MRNSILIGIFVLSVAAGSPLLFAQSSGVNEIELLKQRVARLEKQVQEISRLVEPLKAQQTADNRRQVLREKFELKIAADRKNYTREQLREAEELYQVANQKWGSPEATESLQKMMKKYPDINRTGCAALYVAQKTEGDKRARYLQECIEKYNDCMYGDGVQVGVYARFLLAEDYREHGETEKANALFGEIETKYADAVDHSGRLLVESIKVDTK